MYVVFESCIHVRTILHGAMPIEHGLCFSTQSHTHTHTHTHTQTKVVAPFVGGWVFLWLFVWLSVRAFCRGKERERDRDRDRETHRQTGVLHTLYHAPLRERRNGGRRTLAHDHRLSGLAYTSPP